MDYALWILLSYGLGVGSGWALRYLRERPGVPPPVSSVQRQRASAYACGTCGARLPLGAVRTHEGKWRCSDCKQKGL